MQTTLFSKSSLEKNTTFLTIFLEIWEIEDYTNELEKSWLDDNDLILKKKNLKYACANKMRLRMLRNS